MKQKLSFLQQAADYKVIFNKFRGGYFEKTLPQIVEAYGTTWTCTLKWLDKGWSDFTVEYSPNGEVTLPEKIYIERKEHSMRCWQKNTETVYFYGKEIMELNDDWGRNKFTSLIPFKAELETAKDEKELISIIKKIQKREYFVKVSSFLDEKGFTSDEKKRFFRCKANWKYEKISMKLALIRREELSKSLFVELSQCDSHRRFNEITKKWGIDEKFEGLSLPRKKSYCELIAACKKHSNHHTDIKKEKHELFQINIKIFI